MFHFLSTMFLLLQSLLWTGEQLLLGGSFTSPGSRGVAFWRFPFFEDLSAGRLSTSAVPSLSYDANTQAIFAAESTYAQGLVSGQHTTG